MQNIYSLVAITLLLSANLLAQQNKINYIKTSDGLEYSIIKKGKGPKVQKGYRVYVNYTTHIKPDSVFDSNAGKPYAFILGQEEVLKGWDEGVAMLSVGDSAVFRIPPALAYGEKKFGSIPANTTLLLEIKVLKSEQAFYDLRGKDTIVYKSGLKKINISKGLGAPAKAFTNVTMQFTGYVLNTKGYKRVFQSSMTSGELAVFQLGIGRMVKGLDEGIATMNIGEKATFIVPPSLGFGMEKSRTIPGNSTLYFDIELLSSVDPFFHPVTTDTIFAKNGLKIVPMISKQGKTITAENVVVFNYTAYFIDSLGHPVIFDNTIERKQPAVLRSGSRKGVPGLELGLTYLRGGEKAVIYIPSALGYGDLGKGIVPKNTPLIFDVQLLDTKEYPFFEVKEADTLKKLSGLKYIQVRKGIGEAVDTGSSVKIAYTGYVLDSMGHRSIFDASRESGKNLEIVIGKGNLIKGFDEGIRGMTLSEGRRLIIPYQLGYGETGNSNAGIPPKATLYFDVELVEIKKQK